MNPSFKAHKIILLLLVMSFAVQMTLSSLSLTVVLLGGQVISLLVPLVVYLMATGGSLTERLGLRPCTAADILRGIGITLFLQPFLMLIATVAENLAGNPMDALLESLVAEPVWITVLGLAIFPALIEEVVFRGFLLGSYKGLPLWGAAVLNGLVFGMFHMNAYQFSYAMVLGVFLSVITRQSGSILPAMTMHFLNNLISVVLIYRMDSSWYVALEKFLAAGVTPGAGLIGGFLTGGLSLGIAWGLLFFRQSETSSEIVEPETVKAQQLTFDWPLLFLLLVFFTVAVIPPMLQFMERF